MMRTFPGRKEESGIEDIALDNFDLDPQQIIDFLLVEFFADGLHPKTTHKGLEMASNKFYHQNLYDNSQGQYVESRKESAKENI
jgi:hypothetical protein